MANILGRKHIKHIFIHTCTGICILMISWPGFYYWCLLWENTTSLPVNNKYLAVYLFASIIKVIF